VDERRDAALDDLLALAVHAAQAAGSLLLERVDAAHDVATKSSATDPVSDADRASEALLVDLLTTARPRDGLLGEEGADRASGTGLRWVVDPLDGTVNYLYGLPTWSVSVACEAEGEDGWDAVVGVVHAPLQGETFRACRGGGAWLGQRRLAVNDPVPLERALVATGFGYAPEVRALQAAVAARLLPRVRDVRRIGSAAVDLCLVAAGRVDGYYEDTSARWDWAAGALIAREAGAVVARLPGADADTSAIAAGPALYPALRAAVTEGAAT
jgi:myo-inositol-1(or 4)-monophosphatase